VGLAVTHSIFFTSDHGEEGWIPAPDQSTDLEAPNVGLVKVKDLHEWLRLRDREKTLRDYDTEAQAVLHRIQPFYLWLLCSRNIVDLVFKVCALDPRINYESALEQIDDRFVYRLGHLFGSETLLDRAMVTKARFMSVASEANAQSVFYINRRNKSLHDYLQDVMGVQTRLDDGIDRLEVQLRNPKDIQFKTYNSHLEHYLNASFQPVIFSRVQNELESARKIVRTHLDHSDLRLTDVAELMNISPRTLQRRLRSVGSSFSELLDSERLNELEIQRRAGRTLEDIAEKIGLQDVRSVYRLRQRLQNSSI